MIPPTVPSATVTWAKVATVTALGVSAAGGFAPLFGGSAHLPLLAGAALLPGVVGGSLALAAPRVPGWLRAAVTLAALTILTFLLANPGAAVVDGPQRLLTGALPLDPEGPERFAVALAVGLTATTGIELALRGTRSPLTPAVPAVAAFTVALAVGASGPRPPVALPALLVVGAGILLTLDAPRGNGRRAAPSGPRLAGAAPGQRRQIVPRALAAAAMLAAASALAGVFGPSLPGSGVRAEPVDARDFLTQPVTPMSLVSPLSDLPAVRSGPPRTLFTVRSDRPLPPLRVATLTEFDGRLWSGSGEYLRAGRTLPPAPAGDAPADGQVDTYQLDIEVVEEDQTAWLPAAGRPVAVSVSGLGVEAVTGDVAVPADQDLPGRLKVTSVTPRFTEARLRSAVVARHDQPSDYQLTDRLFAAVGAAARSTDTAFEQLAQLEGTFRRGFREPAEDGAPGGIPLLAEQFRLVQGPGAPAGHGLHQIDELLHTGQGTSEQYASAFAVIARALGYDARVVVGFRVPADEPPGEYAIGNDNAHAWPEVRLEGLGWAPFDPTPRQGGPAGAAAAEERGPEGSVGAVVENAVDQELDGAAPPGAPDEPPPPGGGPRPPWTLLTVMVVFLALGPSVAASFLPVVNAAVRARRRRRGDPARRVSSAWRDTLERLAEQGLRTTPPMTSGEVVTSGTAQLGPRRTNGLRELAALVDAARYGQGTLDEHRAAAAWALSDRVRRSLASDVPIGRRALHLVDPHIVHRRWRHRRTGRRSGSLIRWVTGTSVPGRDASRSRPIDN